MLKCYMLIDGIPGDCVIKGYEKWVEIFAYDTGISQTVSAALGGGNSPGRAQFREFHVIKQVDGASSKLALACAQGSQIKTITMDIPAPSPAGQMIKIASFKLLDCIVRSWEPKGLDIFITSNLSHPSFEEVSFNFGKLEFSTFGTAPDGLAVKNVMGWDIAKNQSYVPAPDPVKPIPR